jgi:hypothetical protein
MPCTGRRCSHNVSMAAQKESAAAALARREHGSAELDQRPVARQQGAELRTGNQAPSNDAPLQPPPAADILEPSMSSHAAAPAENSSNSSSDALTPLPFPAQQQQSQQPSLVVFSGGTAFNTVAGQHPQNSCQGRSSTDHCQAAKSRFLASYCVRVLSTILATHAQAI